MSSVLERTVAEHAPQQRRGRGTHLVLSPNEPLVEGSAAEAFERSTQALFREGHRHLVVDLGAVGRIDGAGVRALVRAHTTAHRIEGSFRLASANAEVRAFLEQAKLDGVFPIAPSVEDAQVREWPWRAIGLVAGGSALCLALVWGGIVWGEAASGLPTEIDLGAADPSSPASLPFLALLKLAAAAAIGLLVTLVHAPTSRDRRLNRSMEQAQVLLCVAGAMVMIIIGDSIARAFGIAGAASIIRFRTPVEDPKDITILFLLMGLGMAAGLGAFAMAGLATAFLCVCLLALDRLPSDERPREMIVEVVAEGREFPVVHVESLFARNGIIFEPRDVSQGKATSVKYHVELDRRLSLEDLSAQLSAAGAGVSSVAWKNAKKGAR